MRVYPALVFLTLARTAAGQSLDKVPAFEVADVKPSKGESPNGGKIRILPGGRLEMPNTTVKRLIMGAYGVQEDMVIGGPNWIDSDEFDIIAKAPPDTPRETIRAMLQPLLAERFKLVVHREDRPKPIYALVVARDGPKLNRSTGGQTQCTWNNPGNGMIQRDCHSMTMKELAAEMAGWAPARIDLPVVDLTGLSGSYDFQMKWSVPSGGGDDAAGPGGATIFDAMSQIGLRLEPRKHPVSVIVIDHVERVPTGN